MRQRPRRTVELTGKLYWDALADVLPAGFILPELRSPEDSHQFGWMISKSPPRRKLIIDNLLYATAEAIVGLAATMDALQSDPLSESPLALEFGDRAAPWAIALGFLRPSAEGPGHITDQWTEVGGCQAHALLQFDLEKESDVSERAAALTQAVARLPEVVLSQRSEDMHDLLLCVRRVVSEALLNVWQHAYPGSSKKPVYVGMTVSPAGHYESPGTTPESDLGSKYRAWLGENKESLILEIAIADRGLGIPKTLWPDAEKRKLAITQQSVWRAPGSLARAQCQQFLCEYAFDHRSTSKQKDDFRNRAALLSWRGWHRGMKLTAHLRGCIYVSSGLGRAGYAFVGRRMVPFTSVCPETLEFPGTMAVLRFSTVRKHTVNTSAVRERARPVELDLTDLVLEKDVLDGMPTQGLERFPNGEARTAAHRALGIVFPFKTIREVGELLQVIEHAPPDRVLVLLLGEMPDEVLIELRAQTNQWDDIKHGLPRLLCIWSPNTTGFRWALAGAVPVPSDEDRVYGDLEKQGYADLQNESAEIWMLARELSRNYPGILHLDEQNKRITFTAAGVLPTSDQLSRALALAFRCAWGSGLETQSVFRAPEGKVVRLPSGRYVRAALSVLNMLRALPLLTETLRVRLNQIIVEVGQTTKLLLLTDGPASYLVACALLGDQKNAPRVVILGSRLGDLNGTQTVLFIDLFSRINTVRKALQELQHRGITPSPKTSEFESGTWSELFIPMTSGNKNTPCDGFRSRHHQTGCLG